VDIFIQVLANGILFGTIYGIAAIGLSLIFGTMRIIFLAQGTFIVLFAYGGYWLFRSLGIDPYLSLAIIIPGAILLGFGLYYGVFKEAAIKEDRNISLLLAVGLMYLLENIMLMAWKADPRSIVTPYTGWVYRPFDITLPFTRLIALLISILSATGVFVFLKKTLIGTAVRAASEEPVSTTLLGINPNWVNAVAFAIGIGLAGIAGVTMATIYPFEPSYGFTFAIKALISLALGGIGNVGGALLGGILLGLIENLSSYYIGSGWADAISYGVFILVLIFRPQGILGKAIKKA
jgi:branched-chain amino acid transport system permease protein